MLKHAYTILDHALLFKGCLCWLEQAYGVLEQGVFPTGSCFYSENQVFGDVSKLGHVLNRDMFLVATISYKVAGGF